MKLDEALKNAKAAQKEHYDGLCMSLQGCCDYDNRCDDLIAAIEEHLEAERKSAEMLLALADLQRHGGE